MHADTRVLVVGAAACIGTFFLLYTWALHHMLRGADRHDPDFVELLDATLNQIFAWSFLETLYYVFIFASCIGFGDLYVYHADDGDVHSVGMKLKHALVFLLTTLVAVALAAHTFSKVQAPADKLVESRGIAELMRREFQQNNNTNSQPTNNQIATRSSIVTTL